MSMYNDTSQNHPLYREEDEPHVHFAELESHSDTQQFPASSSQIHPLPHPYPLFSRQEDMNSSSNRSLDPHSLTSHHSVQHSSSSFATLQHQSHLAGHESAHGWPRYQQRVSQPFSQANSSAISLSYPPPTYPSPSPFPPTRLSPPPVNQAAHYKGQGVVSSLNSGGFGGSPSGVSNSRLTLAGSLDPATGIFYRTPEHPRLRTAQACEKCRTRKAKCSGEHPSCKRCITRGLICEYAKEGRVRGPNKQKSTKTAVAVATGAGGVHGPSLLHSLETSSGSNASGSGKTSRNRTGSIHSSSSSEHMSSELSTNATSTRSPPRGSLMSNSSNYSPMPTAGDNDFSTYRSTLRKDSFSFSQGRASLPRPPDLQLHAARTIRGLPCEELGMPEIRDIPCMADPYFTYQERYQDHQDQREVFAGVPLDPIQLPPMDCQPQHQLHVLPQRPVSSRSRELPQVQTRCEYPSGIIDQAGNVLMQAVETHGLTPYGVEDPLTYLPPPDTFASQHQIHTQSNQAQISHEQRVYEEILDQRTSRWREPGSEVFSDSRTSATSRATPPLTSTAQSGCLSSVHTSMNGNAGLGVATGPLASGRAASPPSGSAAGLGGGGRARMLMTDYSQSRHPEVLPRLAQVSTELQYALEPVLRDPPPGGILVSVADGSSSSASTRTFGLGQGSSQGV